jgi:hypothetical protein
MSLNKIYKYVNEDISYIIYPLSHILIGYKAASNINIGIIFIIYQIMQLRMGERVFMMHKRRTRDNSEKHTIRKMIEFMIGYKIGEQRGE